MPMQRHQLGAKAVFKAITDNATFATVLHIICLVAYGEEIYGLDPLELKMRLEDDFHAELTEENESKLSAIMLATSTNIFYEQADAFQSISNTLLEGDPGLGLTNDLTVPEILFAIWEVEANHGPWEFSPAVCALIAQTIENEAPELDQGAEAMGYVNDALEEAKTKLQAQLEAIGVDTRDLPSMAPKAPPAPLLTA